MVCFNLVFLIFIIYLTIAYACYPGDFGKDSFVCVCQTNCEKLGNITTPKDEYFNVYETDQILLRFAYSNILKNNSTNDDKEYDLVIKLDKDKQYQSIQGFGGAFTDASGINLLKMPKNTRDLIINDYFSSEGLSYTMARVPIGGTDFSERPYTYNNVEGDFDLENFFLTQEDFEYKIPFIIQAKNLVPNLKLVASAWSSPPWMKVNNTINFSFLKGNPSGKYYRTWARYYVKFFEEYSKHGITFWALTTGNEPTKIDLKEFNALIFTPETQRDFIKMDLGPELHKAKLNIKLLILDDTKFFIPNWPTTILNDKEALNYVDGIAFHWYFVDSYEALDIIHRRFPQCFLLSTEACEGYRKNDVDKVSLGNWTRAENYAYDIINCLNNWSTGWIDWNIVLDKQGGPNWVKNFVDAPIIVNDKLEEYYRQPTYYALAHFTKFLKPGSTRVDHQVTGKIKNVYVTSFIDPEGYYVIVVLNKGRSNLKVSIKPFGLSKIINKKSITTFYGR